MLPRGWPRDKTKTRLLLLRICGRRVGINSESDGNCAQVDLYADRGQTLVESGTHEGSGGGGNSAVVIVATVVAVLVLGFMSALVAYFYRMRRPLVMGLAEHLKTPPKSPKLQVQSPSHPVIDSHAVWWSAPLP